MPTISKINLLTIGTSIGKLDDGRVTLPVTPVKPPTVDLQTVGTKDLPPIVGTPVSVDPVKTVSSGNSIKAYHSTLFRNFHLRVVSTYNFYLDGEDVAPTADTSGSLDDLPRYVTLRWNLAPTLVPPPGSKRVKPHVSPEVIRPPTAVGLDVANGALANGYIEPGVISAIMTPAPVRTMNLSVKINEDQFLLDPSAAGQSAADHLGDERSPYSLADLSVAAKPVVVKFVDPSIAGVVDPNRILIATDPVHLTVAGSLTKVLGSLEVLSEFNQDVQLQNPAPDFTGFPDVPTVVYVGYVIERHDLQPDGSMVLGRTILIDDPTNDEFIDQQVAYGGTYTYRIRSVVQWTRVSNLDFNGLSTIDRQTEFSSLTAPPLSSFYAGDWSDWERVTVVDALPPDPPDEVTVRPVSSKAEIHVSWKNPNDPQRDLTSIVLLRAVKDGGKISDWTIVREFVVGNGMYIDRDVLPHEESRRSYIYALYSNSVHGVISPLSDQIEARISSRSSREEFPVIQVSPAGADPMTHASSRLMVTPTEIKANRRLTFYCRSTVSGHPLRDSTYIVEVRSLATGERALVTLDVDATDIGVADA